MTSIEVGVLMLLLIVLGRIGNPGFKGAARDGCSVCYK
jgi:hypothetical protein